jgi:hypothetical protein
MDRFIIKKLKSEDGNEPNVAGTSSGSIVQLVLVLKQSYANIMKTTYTSV